MSDAVWELVDSRKRDGDLWDVWEHRETGERREAPLGDHPDEGRPANGR